MPTDPIFEKVKALLDPIIATLPTVGAQKQFEPMRKVWSDRSRASFTAESGRMMSDLDSPGMIVVYNNDMYPSERGEIFVTCYDWAGTIYKKLADNLASACTRAGYPARLTIKKKSLVVAVKVDIDQWYA